MLLWKSWRDLRITFFVGLGWLALQLLAAIWVLLRGAHTLSTTIATPDQAVDSVGLFIVVQTVVFALISSALGTHGVGRDIGAGSGSFVLTRPVRRAFYVWSEWGAGLIAIAALLFLSVLDLWIMIRSHAFRIVFGTSTNGAPPTPHAWTLASLPVRVAAMDALCAFLLLALVFALAHLGTVAFHHSTAGLLFCLGFFIGWLIVTGLIRHNVPWLAPHIPDLLLHPFGSIGIGPVRPVPHVFSSILERLAILPLFPLAAQLLLGRTEV